MQTAVSVIICTKNRAGHLRETLSAFVDVEPPEGVTGEILVVDNGSTDDTSAVAASVRPKHLDLRVIQEPHGGQATARNTGMAASIGDVIVFTDDDVRPLPFWLSGMCEPILDRRADAVAGGVKLAPHVLRSWMQPEHRAYLASSEPSCNFGTETMKGANMAFSRSVLSRVPAFDPELGPGALGFWDDSLFSLQLGVAGYRTYSAPEVVVEHHCDLSRLTRTSFANRMEHEGNSVAYVAYHWQHRPVPNAVRTLLRLSVTQRIADLKNRSSQREDEGMPVPEMKRRADIAFYRHILLERRMPRKYALHGLVKYESNGSSA